MSMENVLVFKFSVDTGLIVKEINYGIDKYYMENEVVATSYYYSSIESKIIYGKEKNINCILVVKEVISFTTEWKCIYQNS